MAKSKAHSSTQRHLNYHKQEKVLLGIFEKLLAGHGDLLGFTVIILSQSRTQASSKPGMVSLYSEAAWENTAKCFTSEAKMIKTEDLGVVYPLGTPNCQGRIYF